MISLVLMCAMTTAAGSNHAIFVDPLHGNDASTGNSLQSPLQSLEVAAQTARRLIATFDDANVTVHLLPGRHRIENGALSLGAEDGGGAHGFVTWSSADLSDPAIVDGGIKITGWKESNVVPGALVAPLPSTVSKYAPLRQLWVGGKRARRPRVWIARAWQGNTAITDHDSTANLTNVTNATGWVGFNFTTQAQLHGAKYDPSLWPNIGDVEFVFHSSFIEPRCTAASVDDKIVSISQPCFGDLSQRRQGPTKCIATATHTCPGMRDPWFIENVFTNLTAEAGQWYYHRANGTIFYMPRPGETTASVGESAYSTIEETLLVVNQTQNMAWMGVTFEHGTWFQPSLNRGYVDWQAGYSGGIYGTYPHYSDCRTASGCRAFADANGCGNTTKPAAHCGYGLGHTGTCSRLA
jgi:hypothetical protein